MDAFELLQKGFRSRFNVSGRMRKLYELVNREIRDL